MIELVTGELLLDRQLKRWYKLKDHPTQLELMQAVNNGIRFPLVPAGRRSGKTERFKRFLVKQASKVQGLYFAAAPTYNQAKKIFWSDLKEFCLSSTLERKPSESDLQIFLPNGSEIHVLGLDKPERIEGAPWKGGGIDEFANIKDEAWQENILPALNTVNPLDPDYRAWCWCLGVPDGLNHYYDLCEDATLNPDFQVFHWESEDILPPDVIKTLKASMSTRQYNQECKARFETASGRIYEDFSAANETDAVIENHEQLHWMHDQNYTPLSSAVGVIRNDDCLFLLDEIVLTSAISKQSAMEFVDKYKDHGNKHVIIYGDPAGRAGEKHGHASDYTDMEGVLKSHGWQYTRKVELSAPAIKDRQNAVRSKIKTASCLITLFVNKKKAKWCYKGLATVQLQKGSTFQEDQKNKYQHITTAIGYMVAAVWPCEDKLTNININF